MATVQGNEIVKDSWAQDAIREAKGLLEVFDALDDKIKVMAKSMAEMNKGNTAATAKEITALNKALNDLNKTREKAIKNNDEQSKAEKRIKLLERQRLEEIKLAKAREKAFDDYEKKAQKQAKIVAEQSKPWNQLNSKIKQLTDSYRNLLVAEGKETAETKKLKAEILALNRVRDTANENLGMHQNKVGQYERALGSLKNMLAQLGLAFGVFELMKSSFNILADFDEKLADIAKTTGLTIEGARGLSLELLKIDTRTSITELQELASAAGRLNIEGTENIIGFARAADKVFVALGDDLDGTAEEIATGLGKISALAGFEKKFGIEGGIERIGSMLNELASSSKASAGAIFDFLNRTAGISSVAGIAVEDMAALGALFDSTGQSVEIAATTLNTLLPALSSDQERFAKVAGLTAEAFGDMLKNAPIEALKAVAVGAKSGKGGLDGLVESLGDFGVDSSRAASIVGVLASSTEELTRLQKESTQAVIENTSVQDEFNTKNDTLNASVEKLKKKWQELVIEWSNGTGVGESLKNVIDFLADNLETIVNVVITGVKAWASYKVAMSLFRKEVQVVGTTVDATGQSINVMGNVAVGLIPNIINLGKAFLGSVRGITSVRGAMQGLGTAIRSIPLAGFVSFLVTVGPMLWDFASGLFESAESSTALGKATEEANKQIAEEQAKMQSLFEQLKQTNLSSKERKNLIDEINSTYGTTIQNLSDEEAFASQVAAAYAQINAQLEKKIRNDVYQQSLTDLIKDEIEIKKLIEKNKSLGIEDFINVGGDILLADQLTTIQKEKAALLKAISDLNTNVSGGKGLGRQKLTIKEDEPKDPLKPPSDKKEKTAEQIKADELTEYKKQKALELLEYENFLLREGSRTREQIDSLIGLEEVAIARSTVDKIIELDFESKEVLIEHDNAYLKKVEENRVNHIEILKTDEEELTDKVLEEAQKRAQEQIKQAELEKELQAKRKQEAKDALAEQLQDFTDYMKERADIEAQTIDNQIANREKEISDSQNEISRLQALGTENAAEAMKAEKEAIDKDKLAIEGLQKKKRDLLLKVTALELASSKIQKGLSIDGVGADLKAMFAGLPSFFKGTPDGTLGDMLGRDGKKDSKLIWADENEFIIPAKDSIMLKKAGFNGSNDIVSGAMMAQTLGAENKAISNSRLMRGTFTDKNIVEELRNTQKAISEIQQTHFDFSSMIEVIRKGNEIKKIHHSANKYSI